MQKKKKTFHTNNHPTTKNYPLTHPIQMNTKYTNATQAETIIKYTYYYQPEDSIIVFLYFTDPSIALQ